MTRAAARTASQLPARTVNRSRPAPPHAGHARLAVLALDFDGVLCDGRAEYFEASSRAYGHVWSPATLRAPRMRDRFFHLRPVIMSGWEMPVLLRAIVDGAGDRRILDAWPDVRERTLAALEAGRDAVVGCLRRALDDVRRDWITIDPRGWLAANPSYAPVARLRAVVAAADHTAIVTTKEGEFARRILAAWGLEVADVQGKEAGEHKCENLLGLVSVASGGSGESAFVEDRLETLECVVRCSRREPRLASIRLYLADWGYTTAAARAAAAAHPRIRLLGLPTFLRGPAAWPAS